ncbi:MAG: F0F1 ATP synthase subunit gamma, partial [Rhodovulum sp.]
MEDLARIEARRASLEELGQLVGALRSMAAARAREAQAGFEGTRAYVGIIDRAIAELAQPAAMDAPAGAGERVLLLITSENGFVGGFNTALVEHAIAARAPGETLILV